MNTPTTVATVSLHGARPATRALDEWHRDGHTMDLTTADAKAAARTLRADLGRHGVTITHADALELVSHQLGYRDWNTACAVLGRSDGDAVGVGEPVPVLRVQRFADAREFYLDFLGFVVEWEHRFEPGMPLYVRLTRGAARIDLSEHHGDGTPGSVVWIPVADVTALHRELQRKNNPAMRPGVDRDAPGGPTLSVVDPFGNSLSFCEEEG